MSKSLLILERSSESLTFNTVNKEYVFDGVFTKFGIRNKNGRIYEKSNFLECLKPLQTKVNSTKLLGELDHPHQFDVTLGNASHVIESLTYDNVNDQVLGRIKLLDTPKGQIAKALVDAGVPLQISSRAAGVVENDGSVNLKRIFTYDLVADPGFECAELKRVNEQFGFEVDDSIYVYEMNSIDITPLKTPNPANTSGNLTITEFNQYSANLVKQISDVKEELKANSGINEKFEQLEKWVSKIATTLNGVAGYSNHLYEELEASIKHNDHLTESLESLKNYTNFIVEKINEGTEVDSITALKSELELLKEFTDYSNETLSKDVDLIKEFTEYSNSVTENAVVVIKEHSEHIVESVNLLIEHNDHVIENLNSLEINTSVVPIVESTVAVVEEINEANYISDLNQKVLDVVNNAKKQNALKAAPIFLSYVSESKKTDWLENVNSTEKQKLEKAFEGFDVNTGNADEIWESTLVDKSSEVSYWLKNKSTKYNKLWESLSDEVKVKIHAQAEMYNLIDESSVEEFWSKIESEVTSLKLISENVNLKPEITPIIENVEENSYLDLVFEQLKQNLNR